MDHDTIQAALAGIKDLRQMAKEAFMPSPPGPQAQAAMAAQQQAAMQQQGGQPMMPPQGGPPPPEAAGMPPGGPPPPGAAAPMPPGPPPEAAGMPGPPPPGGGVSPEEFQQFVGVLGQTLEQVQSVLLDTAERNKRLEKEVALLRKSLSDPLAA